VRPKPDRCSVEGCQDGGRISRGLCKPHYDRARVRGTLDEHPTLPPRSCTIDGCDEPHRANGYCNRHAHNYYLTGDPLSAKERGEVTCPACNHPDRSSIDLDLFDHGASPALVARYGIARATLNRHRAEHAGIPSTYDLGCSVCRHPDVDRLDSMLRSGVRGTKKAVAAEVGIYSARYHVLHHLDNPEQAARVAAFHIARLAFVRSLPNPDPPSRPSEHQ
jgi:hypothetical protein